MAQIIGRHIVDFGSQQCLERRQPDREACSARVKLPVHIKRTHGQPFSDDLILAG
jgi:hypothetical protein